VSPPVPEEHGIPEGSASCHWSIVTMTGCRINLGLPDDCPHHPAVVPHSCRLIESGSAGRQRTLHDNPHVPKPLVIRDPESELRCHGCRESGVQSNLMCLVPIHTRRRRPRRSEFVLV
jgi:hypothetical protein